MQGRERIYLDRFWNKFAAKPEAISVSPMENLEKRIAALEQEVWAGSKPPRSQRTRTPAKAFNCA